MLGRTGERLPLHPAVLVAAAIAGAALTGTAMAHSIQLGVAAAVALCFGPLVLLDLPLGLVLWIPSTSLAAVAALDVGPNVLGMLILLTWFGALEVGRSRLPEAVLRNARILWLTAALVLWVVVSVAWHQRPQPSGEAVVNWLVAGAIMLVICTTLTDRRHIRLAAGAAVVGVVASVSVGFVGGNFHATSHRLAGGTGDPNFLAAGCAPAIVLAAGLAAGTQRRAVRWLLFAAMALITVGLAASESRGGFLAMIVAAVGSVVLIRTARARFVALLLCVVGVGATYFALNPDAWVRMSSFHDDSGRSELWSVAWQMWQDHPLVGVGVGGFVTNLGDYARELGPLEHAKFIAEQPHLVHNSFLEMMAENGLVGLGLYIAVIAVSLRCAWRAARRFEELGDLAMATLARALIVSVLAMLTSGFFISATTDRPVWVLLALGPALLTAASGPGAPANVALGRRRPRRVTGAPLRRSAAGVRSVVD